MSRYDYVSKTVPDQHAEIPYGFLFSGVNTLIYNAKIEQNFLNLIFFIIFSQNAGLFGVVMFGAFI